MLYNVNMKTHKIAYFLIAIVFLFNSVAYPVMAQSDFNPNYILADQDLFDYESLSFDQIRSFLSEKGSTLSYYKDPITSMLAADIIYHAAQDYKVNPKYLIALLQKEQSLIEHGSPSDKKYDWATGYGICDSCSMDDPKLLKFKGFYNQVYSAAKFIRLENDENLLVGGKTFTGFGPGITKRVDGVSVTPANNATSLLYTYTPHIQGNELLWTIWLRYFARSYPDGMLLNVEGEREVWLIKDGVRRQFATRSVYLSYYPDFKRVVSVNETELKKYPQGPEIKFGIYSFLRSPKGTVYLLLPDDVIRGFASKEALRQIGINPSEIIDVEQEDLNQYSEGQPITIKSMYPLGTLIQNSKTGGVYFVQEGVKHPIPSKAILKANFGSKKITSKLTPEKLDQFTTGEPVLFRDGDLVKSPTDPAVYLISGKKRRPILSESAFTKLGLEWSNVIETDDASLLIHELGEPVSDPF